MFICSSFCYLPFVILLWPCFFFRIALSFCYAVFFFNSFFLFCFGELLFLFRYCIVLTAVLFPQGASEEPTSTRSSGTPDSPGSEGPVSRS